MWAIVRGRPGTGPAPVRESRSAPVGPGSVNRLRVGVISDVHSNLPALQAVLESIDAAAPEEIWCLGDVVGYGAQPDECTELVRQRCAVSLNGNHDLAVTGEIDAAPFSAAARGAVDR